VAKKLAKKTVKKTVAKPKTGVKKAVKKTVKKAVAKPRAAKKTVKKAPAQAPVKRPTKKSGGLTIKKVAKTTARAAKGAAQPKLTPKTNGKKLTKSPLTKTQLKTFTALLLAKRQDLVGDMNGIHAETFGSTGDLSNMPTHPADIGSDNFEQEFTLGLLESERQMLTEINEALDRVTAGNYGICLGTSEAINLARLKARPWAKYGIEYARMIEQGLVHPNDDVEDGE
jgi:DnaK suppressor protein